MVLCKTMIVLLLAIMMSNLCFHFQPVSFRGCLSSFPVQDLRNYCKVFAWYLCQFQVSTRQFFCHKLSNVSIHFRTMPTSLYYVYICSICMYSSVESPCLYQCLSATYHCCCFRTATSGQNLHLVMFFSGTSPNRFVWNRVHPNLMVYHPLPIAISILEVSPIFRHTQIKCQSYHVCYTAIPIICSWWLYITCWNVSGWTPYFSLSFCLYIFKPAGAP
jgi:hypothetical protein